MKTWRTRCRSQLCSHITLEGDQKIPPDSTERLWEVNAFHSEPFSPSTADCHRQVYSTPWPCYQWLLCPQKLKLLLQNERWCSSASSAVYGSTAPSEHTEKVCPISFNPHKADQVVCKGYIELTQLPGSVLFATSQVFDQILHCFLNKMELFHLHLSLQSCFLLYPHRFTFTIAKLTQFTRLYFLFDLHPSLLKNIA